MPTHPEEILTYHALYTSPLVSVSDYCCRACQREAAPEESSERNNVVLLRHGLFARHFGKRHATTDVNQSTFFTKDSTYRVSHPAGAGDRGTVFSVSPRVLNDMVRELDRSVDEHPERPFPFDTGPCEPTVFWRHREFVLRLEEASIRPMEPLWADVTALQLVADVLQAAFARHGKTRRPQRSATDADHLERAEAAKIYLASHLSERITLDDVARAVHASPLHLARVFQQRTGAPVHRYLTRLRLRASLERLMDGAADLTALALELGFSSHSHFTDAFRREFGCAPSEVRTRGRALRQMSKKLEV